MAKVNVVLKSVWDDKGIKNAQKEFQDFGKKIGVAFAAVGAVTAAAAAGLVRFGASSLAAAENVEQANNRLGQVAKTMGLFGTQTDAVTQRLIEFAEANELTVAVDAEVIKQTQAKLLTFKELAGTADEAGGAFDRATMAALDLAAAGFGSAESNATQLGKALQDPIKGLTALTRSGVTFTQVEKDKIKALVQSGQTLEAQNMILTAIETQVGGTAAATAKASDQIKLAFDNISEAVGAALLPTFKAFADELIALTPEIEAALAPAAAEVATIFREQVLPAIKEFTAWLASPEGTQTLKDLTQAVVDAIAGFIDFVGWVIQNRDAIATLTTALGIAYISFKTITAAQALWQAALVLTTTQVTVATGATTALASALRLLPWVAVATGAIMLVGELGKYADEVYGSKISTEGLTEAQAEQALKVEGLQRLLGQYQYALENGTEANKELAREGIARVIEQLEAMGVRTDVAGQHLRDLNNISLSGLRREVFSASMHLADLAGVAGQVSIANILNPDKTGGGGGGGGGGAKNPVSEFFKGLGDEVEKQAARIKLQNMGASAGLIDAILGSGSDWKKVFDNIVKGGSTAIQKAQAQFNKTAAGIREIASATDELSDSVDRLAGAGGQMQGGAAQPIEAGAEFFPGSPNFFQSMGIIPFGEAFYGRERYFQQYGADEAAKAYWDALAASEGDVYAALTEQARVYYQFQDEVYQRFQKLRREQRNNFNRNVQEAFAIFNDPEIQANLGGYIDSVEALRSTLIEAINANPFVNPGQGQYALGLFTERSQRKLIKSITETTDLMITVAQARLDLMPKLEQAQNELQRITGERTSLFNQMVNSVMGGVDITKLGTSSTAITKSLTKTLEQARSFATNLVALRNQGLDPTLLQQLINAGVDAGNVTAKALLKGGPQAVEQINSIYSEIEAVATDIGNTGAGAFFDSGLAAAQSLVDGLLSEQELLTEAAVGLAKVFADSFAKNVDEAMVSMFRGSIEDYIAAINDPTIPWDQVVNPFFPSYRTKENARIFTININPGLVTDPAGLGREVVNAIQRYEQNNGQVFERSRRGG